MYNGCHPSIIPQCQKLHGNVGCHIARAKEIAVPLDLFVCCLLAFERIHQAIKVLDFLINRFPGRMHYRVKDE